MVDQLPSIPELSGVVVSVGVVLHKKGNLSYPVKTNICDVIHRHKPSIIVAAQGQVFAHTSRFRVADVSPVNVGKHVYYAETDKTNVVRNTFQREEFGTQCRGTCDDLQWD